MSCAGVSGIEYDLEEVARRADVEPDVPRRLWRAMGFSDGDGAPALTDADVEALVSVVAPLGSDDAVLDALVQRARVLGASTARIADVMGEALGSRPEAGWTGEAALVELLVRRHLRDALSRRFASPTPQASRRQAVGFADLAGFTLLTQRLADPELAGLVGRFETLSYDAVSELGGRVVKMIGDEVMFVADDAATVARVALHLSEAAAADDLLPDVRAGLAFGPVLTRQGDCFGPIVNLAHRIVKAASPGTVMASTAAAFAVDGTDGLAWHRVGPRWLKDLGFVELCELAYAPESAAV